MNFTPLKLQSFYPQKKVFLNTSGKTSYLIAVIFLVFSLGIFIYSLFLPTKPQSSSLKTSASSHHLFSFKYLSFKEIPFLVKYINNHPTRGQIYFDYLKKQNPDIDEKILTSEVNNQIFTYYILSDFFDITDPFPDDYLTLLKTNNSLVNQYHQNVLKYSGYYIKIRFRGYYGQREQEIKNIFGDQNLKQLAEEKMNNLIKNNPHPSSLFPSLNTDSILSQLNNNEKVIDYFKNNSFEDPLFDDPDFYQYLKDSPLNQYSPIYVLKTKNPLNTQFEEYAFLIFFIEKKEGKNFPLVYLINSKLNEISYR